MLAALPMLLSLIGEIAPAISTATAVGKIIGTLTTALPSIIQEGKDMLPIMQTILTALRSNGAITPEQINQLDALEEQYDAEFEAAATAALAEDAKAKSG